MKYSNAFGTLIVIIMVAACIPSVGLAQKNDHTKAPLYTQQELKQKVQLYRTLLREYKSKLAAMPPFRSRGDFESESEYAKEKKAYEKSYHDTLHQEYEPKARAAHADIRLCRVTVDNVSMVQKLESGFYRVDAKRYYFPDITIRKSEIPSVTGNCLTEENAANNELYIPSRQTTSLTHGNYVFRWKDKGSKIESLYADLAVSSRKNKYYI